MFKVYSHFMLFCCKSSLFMRFMLLCHEICFVAIYALLRGEKLGQNFCLWRKKDKYQVSIIIIIIWFPQSLLEVGCIPASLHLNEPRLTKVFSKSF